MRSDCGCMQDLGDGRWVVRVSGGNDPITGKRIRLSKTVRGTKRDAIAMRTKLLIEAGRTERAKVDMTLGEYISNVWLPFKQNQVEKGEYQRTSYDGIEFHLTRCLGFLEGIKITELTPYLIERRLSEINANSTIESLFCDLRVAMQQAEKWDIIQHDQNPFHRMEKPARKRARQIKTASAEYLVKLMDAWYGHQYEAAFLLLAGCALRVSECTARDWEDFDWRNGTVDIHSSFHKSAHGVRYMAPTKTESSNQEMSLPSGYIADRLYEIACNGAPAPTLTGPIAIKRDGERASTKNLSHAFKKLQEDKFPVEEHIMLKSLRHSQATILVEHGEDIYRVSKRLRHANVKTTDNIYARPKKLLIDSEVADTFSEILAETSTKLTLSHIDVTLKESKTDPTPSRLTQRVPNPWEMIKN